LRDPGLRKVEQASARRERADELRRQRDRFRGQVELILEKGFVYDVEWEALRAEEGSLADDPALRRRLEKAEKRSFHRARADHERLDLATERNLRANLAVLQDSDLYETLRRVDGSITEASAPEQLLAAADGLYRKAINTMDKRNPEIGAIQELAGLAKRIFGSEELMRRYQLSMLLAPLDALLEQYEATLSPVRALDARQVESFLREAAKKRIDLALAQDILVAYFRERNWSVELPSAAKEAELRSLVSCPQCEKLNDPVVEFCVHCGRRLLERCPRCGEKVQASARACGKCGFRTGERYWVSYLIEEAETALARQDSGEAKANIHQARLIWPLGPDSQDELAKRLHEVQRQLADLEAETKAANAKITALIRSDSYSTALRELRGLTVSLPNLDRLLAQCEARVREADLLCRQAREEGLTSERRAALYLDALRICPDHEDARQELGAIPPAAPRDLKVIPHESQGFVRLAWQSSEAGSTFVVIRSDGADPPVSAADAPGQRRFAGIKEPHWDDRVPIIGAPMRYAVYAERSGTVSAEAAVAPQPIFLTAEVRLTVRPGNGQVELSWTLPDNASGVEVLRQETGTEDTTGTLVSAEPGMLLDRDVQNGVRYRYIIHTIFPYPTAGNPDRVLVSKGAIREATPGAAPEPPRYLCAQGHPPPPGMSFYRHRVELRWPHPRRGVIKVVRSMSQPALHYGDELHEHDLGRHGLVLEGSPPVLDTWIEDLRLCHYVPVLVIAGRCYVGRVRRYAAVEEVRDLALEYLGASARLRWAWPEGINEALVAWDTEEEPPDPTAARRQDRVSRRGTEATGEYQLTPRRGQQIFARVAVVVRGDGGEFISSGVLATARRPLTRLRYEVRLQRGLGGRRMELLLRVDHPGWLPALQLRARQDDQPAGPDDILLLTLKPADIDQERIVKIPYGQPVQLRSCRIFLVNEGDASSVDIVGPGSDA
jgi:hypothetical protein